MRTLISIVLLMFAVGCAQAHTQTATDQKLYFAVEVVKDGKVVGKPKLLGENGKALRAERRQPGATMADYALRLKPVQKGARYQISLDVSVPGRTGHSELSLLHGEVRKLELGARPGELAVMMTFMEVDSPEFRALMELTDDRGVGGSGAI